MKIRDLAPFTIRIPLELKERLRMAARGKLSWSLNTEILERLIASFENRGDIKNFTDGELIDELVRRYGRDGIFIRIGKEQETASTIKHDERRYAERRGGAIGKHVDFEIQQPMKDQGRKKGE